MTLQASQLAYSRGSRGLFSGVSFELKPGEALRVAGRNGRGKTSLLRVLCGLALPVEGEVLWRGLPIKRHREALNQDLIYIGHAHGLKDDLSAIENLQISALLSGRPCKRADALEALAQVGLKSRADLPARVLSQGQRRRAVLARLALPHTHVDAPRLLVLDEPFVALDHESVLALITLLDAQLAQGAVLVYTTHQAQALAARHHHTLQLGDPSAHEEGKANHAAEAY